MPKLTNPLRYPGAKRTLANYIDELLHANNLNGCCFLEPYAGSAAVGLELIQRGTIRSLVLCEKDIMIYALWESVFHHTEELCDRISKTPITIDTWYQLNPYRRLVEIANTPLVELGIAGLFFNRTNFSGILKANPIGGINQTSPYSISCRFNKSQIIAIIQKLGEYRNQIEIYCDDAIQFMNRQAPRFFRENCFAYFDPPYFEKGSKIYRHYYTNRDHIALAQYIRGLHYLDWIISYDDAPFICALYGNTGAQYQPFFMDYSCASKVRAQGQELLISNLPLPPFQMANAGEL